MNTNKVYVDVTAVFSKEGQLKPVSVMWQDGHIYEIQRITDIRRAASLKAGGVGMRYTCIIDGKETHLFYEDNNMWFVEGRAGAQSDDCPEGHKNNQECFGTHKKINLCYGL